MSSDFFPMPGRDIAQIAVTIDAPVTDFEGFLATVRGVRSVEGWFLNFLFVRGIIAFDVIQVEYPIWLKLAIARMDRHKPIRAAELLLLLSTQRCLNGGEPS